VKRGAVVGIVIAAVAAVILGVGAWWFLAQPQGPDATARSYLDALAAGDGEKALALLAEPPSDDIDRAEVLDEAQGLVTDVAVTKVETVHGEGTDTGTGTGSTRAGADTGTESTAVKGAARVDVTYSLDGTKHKATLTLVDTGDGWRVGADGLGAVSPRTTLGAHVLVGGAYVPAETETLFLPAVYAVQAAPINILSGTTTAAVTAGGSAEASVEASVSPAAVTKAQEELDLYAQRCAAPAEAVPAKCGIRVPWAADLATLTSIAFRVEQTPQITLSPDLTTFAATGGVIVATATGTTRDGAEAAFTYRADDWALRGTVSLTRDGMQLAVD
jgi:hypothetical protein